MADLFASRGTTYGKVSARTRSTIPLDLTALACTRFQSVVGIDDEVGNNGSVRFQVWNGTTTMLTQSAAITGASAAATIDIDVTNVTNLRLLVTDNGDGNGMDHADWADAKLTCASDTTRPTVTSLNPPDAATGVSATAVPTAQMSEAIDASTVSASTVTLVTQPGGAAVAGTVGYDAASKSITFKPSAGTRRQHVVSIPSDRRRLGCRRPRRQPARSDCYLDLHDRGVQRRPVRVGHAVGHATNGWGPPERDHSNGEQGAADGGPIVIAGTTYAKGVGAHAASAIPLDLTGLACTRFQSVVGLDDEGGEQRIGAVPGVERHDHDADAVGGAHGRVRGGDDRHRHHQRARTFASS